MFYHIINYQHVLFAFVTIIRVAVQEYQEHNKLPTVYVEPLNVTTDVSDSPCGHKLSALCTTKNKICWFCYISLNYYKRIFIVAPCCILKIH
jgi:hypothetical protein